MLALASAWIGLATALIAVVMWVYRPAFTDLAVTAVLYFGAPAALCFAGMVLWAYRKEGSDDPGIGSQRAQAHVGIVLAVVSAAIVYGLIIGSEKIEPIEATATGVYNDVSPGWGELAAASIPW